MTATADLDRYIARREAVLDRVRALLVERLHVERAPDTIDPDTPLFGTGLGLDSVDAVEMVVSLEDGFGIKLPDDALGRRVMRTVGKLVDLVIAFEDARAAEDAESEASDETPGLAGDVANASSTSHDAEADHA